jgi:hypothetical protein
LQFVAHFGGPGTLAAADDSDVNWPPCSPQRAGEDRCRGKPIGIMVCQHEQ